MASMAIDEEQREKRSQIFPKIDHTSPTILPQKMGQVGLEPTTYGL